MMSRMRELVSKIWNGPAGGDKPADLQAFDTARESLIASCTQVTRAADAFGDLLRGMQGKPPPGCAPAARAQVPPRKSPRKKRSPAAGSAPAGVGRAKKKVRKR
jgi:hypothetical protein